MNHKGVLASRSDSGRGILCLHVRPRRGIVRHCSEFRAGGGANAWPHLSPSSMHRRATWFGDFPGKSPAIASVVSCCLAFRRSSSAFENVTSTNSSGGASLRAAARRYALRVRSPAHSVAACASTSTANASVARRPRACIVSQMDWVVSLKRRTSLLGFITIACLYCKNHNGAMGSLAPQFSSRVHTLLNVVVDSCAACA